MATSVVSFLLSGPATSLTKASFDTSFDPSSNIAGEHCYVECTAFSWDYGGTTVFPNTRDCMTLSTSWAQSVSAGVSERGTLPTVSCGSIVNNLFYGHGPILSYIPDGPQQVTFTIERTDGGNVANDLTNTNYLFVAFKMVNASSRQPPIGV